MCKQAEQWLKNKEHYNDKACEEFGKQYDMGDEMYLDDNYCECNKYIVGDNRCDCGNRRVGISYGELLDGTFYFQTEVG